MDTPLGPGCSAWSPAVKQLAENLGKTPYADYQRDMLTMT